MAEIKRVVPKTICACCQFSRPNAKYIKLQHMEGGSVHICRTCLHMHPEYQHECLVCHEAIYIKDSHAYYNQSALAKWPGLINVHVGCSDQYMDETPALPTRVCDHCGEDMPINGNHSVCPKCVSYNGWELCACGEDYVGIRGKRLSWWTNNGPTIKTITHCSICSPVSSCCGCGISYDKSLTHEYHDQYCPSCAKTVDRCDLCVELGYKIRVLKTQKICNRCWNERVRECQGCGSLAVDCGAKYHKHHDRSTYCEQCIGSPILTHSFKKRPTFFGTSGPYFGFENEYEFSAKDYKQHTNSLRKWAYEHKDKYHLVHDGSLQYGVEVVSNPASFEYWMTQEEIIPDNVPNAVHVGTAGCHIHISKDAFTKQHLFKFMKFLCNNFDNFVPVFGRGIQKYCDQLTNTIENIVEEQSNDVKYSWINLIPKPTVELRIFIAAACSNDIKMYMQLLHSVYVYTLDIGPNDMEWLAYYKFLAAHPQYFILIDSLDKRPKLPGVIASFSDEKLREMYAQKLPKSAQPLPREGRRARIIPEWVGIVQEVNAAQFIDVEANIRYDVDEDF